MPWTHRKRGAMLGDIERQIQGEHHLHPRERVALLAGLRAGASWRRSAAGSAPRRVRNSCGST